MARNGIWLETNEDKFLEFPIRDIVRCKEREMPLDFPCNFCDKKIKTKRYFYTAYNDYGICITFCTLPCYEMFRIRYSIIEDLDVDTIYMTIKGILPTMMIGSKAMNYNLPYWLYTADVGSTLRSKRKKK